MFMNLKKYIFNSGQKPPCPPSPFLLQQKNGYAWKRDGYIKAWLSYILIDITQFAKVNHSITDSLSLWYNCRSLKTWLKRGHQYTENVGINYMYRKSCPKFKTYYIKIMVTILDGNSLIGSHVRQNLYYSTFIRHLIKSRAIINRISLSKKPNFPSCVRNML